MQDKKTRLIEASIELFARQGFHATSVQAIVNQANVAKGSFYNYFDSKDELIMSIYDYYSGLIQSRMDEARDTADDPREVLMKQIELFFELLLSNKSLIVMLLQDQISIHQDIETFMKKTKQQNFKWASENITAIYGEAIFPYLNDAVVLLNGILNSYSNWLVIDEASIEMNKLSRFIMNRLDDLCFNLIERQEEPAITKLPDYLSKKELMIQEIEQKLKSHSTDDETKDKALEALGVLNKEIQKEKPERIVIQSMIQIIEHVDGTEKETEQLMKFV